MNTLHSPSVIIDLIRHGEPEGGKRFRGHGIDDPLSEKGWQQMWHAVHNHVIDNNCPWDKVISSPMQRCYEFAKALSEKHNIPCSVEDGLKEVGFGVWEGQTREQLKRDRPDEYEAFYNNPISNRPQGAEVFEDFVERVAGVYERIVHAHHDEHVLVVAHAGVIRAVLIHALKQDPATVYKTRIDNASISRIAHLAQGVRGEFINSS